MQTPSVVLNIGADVAKDEIVVACSEGSFPVRRIANQRAAVTAFLKGLPKGSRIGLKSTGIYHELLAEAAHKLGFVVFVLNPKDARRQRQEVRLIKLLQSRIHGGITRHSSPCSPEFDQLMSRRDWGESRARQGRVRGTGQ